MMQRKYGVPILLARQCIYVYIYIRICSELIEETARHRKLIFGILTKYICIVRILRIFFNEVSQSY